MKKLAILAMSIATLSGCALDQNQRWAEVHNSANTRAVAESQARLEADKHLATAMASAALKCTSDACVMGLSAMLMISKAKNEAVAAIAPVIEKPLDTTLEWGKLLVPAVVSAYGGYLGAVGSIINSTRGAADTDTANQGLKSITPTFRNQQ